MDLLKQHNLFKQRCEEFINTPSYEGLNITEFDEITKIITRTLELPYQEQQDFIKKQQDIYCSKLTDQERFRCHMHWNSKSISNYNSFKDIIIANLQASDTFYEQICVAINSNKLSFSLSEVSKLPEQFIEHCLQTFPRHKPATDEDDYIDDDDVPNNKKCSGAELFLVSCLVHFEALRNKILAKLPCVTCPELYILPTSYTVLEGDNLLEQIHEYYKAKTLPPAIKHRRNILYVFNNNKNDVNSFEAMKGHSVYAINFCALSIEFPHMCYVIPSTIKVDIDSKNMQSKLRAWKGTEVLLVKEPKEPRIIPSAPDNPNTISSSFKNDGLPCTHINIGLGFDNFGYISNPIVSGKAIILV